MNNRIVDGNETTRVYQLGSQSAEWCNKDDPHKGDSKVYIELLEQNLVLTSILFKQPVKLNKQFHIPNSTEVIVR
jgi:hypothetical protein